MSSVYIAIPKEVLKPSNGCLNNRVDELASESEGKQTRASFFHDQKVWSRFKMSLSNGLVQKIPHRCAQALGF